MDECHCPGPVLEILLERFSGFRLLVRAFEAQKGNKRGQVVLDPVVDLREQNFLLHEGIVELVLPARQFLDILFEFFLVYVDLLVRRLAGASVSRLSCSTFV